MADGIGDVFAAFDAASRLSEYRRQTCALVADLARILQTLDRINTARPSVDVEMVRLELEEALWKLHVEEIACLGRPFDPRWHEAAGTRPDEQADAGTVVEVLARGFSCDGEPVVLPRVIVAKGRPDEVGLSKEKQET